MQRTGKCLIKSCKKRELDPCHILTRKAFPQYIESEWNIVYMCRQHHTEQGSAGIVTFGERYPEYKEEIEKRGFEYSPLKLGYFIPLDKAKNNK